MHFHIKSYSTRRSPASGPLRGTAGRAIFLNFCHRSAAGVPRRGRRHSSYQTDRGVTILASYLNTAFFIEKTSFLSFIFPGYSTDITLRGMQQHRQAPRRVRRRSSYLKVGSVTILASYLNNEELCIPHYEKKKFCRTAKNNSFN